MSAIMIESCSNPECSNSVIEFEKSKFGMCEDCYESDGFFLETMSFAELRQLLVPAPKRGRINKVLREKFFIKNESGHWVRKFERNEHFTGVPSRPDWNAAVLPLVIELLQAKYGDSHKIVGWMHPYIEATDT